MFFSFENRFLRHQLKITPRKKRLWNSLGDNSKTLGIEEPRSTGWIWCFCEGEKKAKDYSGFQSDELRNDKCRYKRQVRVKVCKNVGQETRRPKSRTHVRRRRLDVSRWVFDCRASLDGSCATIPSLHCTRENISVSALSSQQGNFLKAKQPLNKY